MFALEGAKAPISKQAGKFNKNKLLLLFQFLLLNQELINMLKNYFVLICNNISLGVWLIGAQFLINKMLLENPKITY